MPHNDKSPVFCELDGFLVATHRRCVECGILFGEEHTHHWPDDQGRCSQCAYWESRYPSAIWDPIRRQLDRSYQDKNAEAQARWYERHREEKLAKMKAQRLARAQTSEVAP